MSKVNAYLFMHICLTAALTRIYLAPRQRYKIALGLASALHYLHNDAEQCVLHRDIKSANLVDPQLRSQTTGLVGTFGYMAPEYVIEGKASKESDMWVWHLYLAGNLLDAADERLGVDFDKNEMECFLIVGLWCTHPSSKERPKAGQVIKVFQLEAPLPKLPHIMPDYPMPQPQQKAQSGSSQSQLFLTSGFNTMGR
ncbi:putative protein kinase RLK-Pelle-RLCK-VI family [Rosa chinensis]|uniref:Protein kinase domain-containing protein n=1 Tax=Rosa chinensis TaxID=74649 RepID=A0A2P6RP43_ROSCH|nr:putative protein kinase RLK-Pelle-RLCK-VI family [Rosa chinensis]